MIFSVPKGALGEGIAVSYEQQVDVNQDTDLKVLLDRIYTVNRIDLKEAERLSKRAFGELQKNPDNDLLARLLNLTAYRKILSLEINASLKDVLQARRLAVEVENQEEEATSYRLEGIISTFVGEYSKGISLFFQALLLQKTLPIDHTYYTLQNISMAYYKMGDYDNHLKYGYILLEHLDSIEGSVKQGMAYSAIGVALSMLGDYAKGKEMLAKAGIIFKSQNSIYLSTVQYSLADVEYRIGNYEKALGMLNESKVLAEKKDYSLTIDNSLSLKAKIESKMGKASDALNTLNELVKFAIKNNNKKAEQEAYRQFSLIYESQGKYQEALIAHQRYKEIADELFNDRSASKIALVEARYNMEKKEQRIALLEAEAAFDEAQHTQMEKTTTLRGYIIVLVILMLFGAVIVVFRIIRTRRILEKSSEQLKEAYRLAEDANNSKSNFLASMSHDLRTPLNAILGYSEAIQLEIKGPLNNPTYQDYISSINSSGKLLLELIDDVLDLSKVEAGKYELVENEISLPAVIMRTLEMIRPIAEANELTIECDCPEGFPKLLADERIMVQVLNNLISNSLKFTPRGGTINLLGSHDNDGDISIIITDNGIGMTEAELIKAMRPFEQIDPEVSQGSGGTGLGLTLCIKYMELHGGELEMSSEKGVGTTTILHFPSSRVIT